MIPKRRVRPKMGVRVSSRIRCTSYLQYVRGRACLAEGPSCFGDPEAHHVRENGNAGTGIKPPDSDAVPLCAGHHAELHRVGAKTFESRHGCDLDKQAVAHWQAWLKTPAGNRFKQESGR